MKCNACKRRIYFGAVQDLLGRDLHKRCKRRANMAPELALLLRALLERTGGFAEFSRAQLFESSPIHVEGNTHGGLTVISAINIAPMPEGTATPAGHDPQEAGV